MLPKKKCREGRNNNIYKNAFWATSSGKSISTVQTIYKHCAALGARAFSSIFISLHQFMEISFLPICLVSSAGENGKILISQISVIVWLNLISRWKFTSLRRQLIKMCCYHYANKLFSCDMSHITACRSFQKAFGVLWTTSECLT